MACHSVELTKVRFTREHLVDRVMTLAKVARHTDVVPWLTGQDTHFCTHCMDR